MSDDAELNVIRELLSDSFNRVAELVEGFCGLPDETATRRPGPGANTIAWLLWHLSRVQDDHVADLAGREQVWADGWYERIGVPFPIADTGFGHSSEQVAQVTTPVDELVAYHDAVHAMSLDYASTVTPTELARVVDTRWESPVTAGVRLVSLLGDCLQHAGQAAYVRGLLE